MVRLGAGQAGLLHAPLYVFIHATPLACAVRTVAGCLPAAHHLPALARRAACRFSLTKNGRQRYARAMAASTALAARQQQAFSAGRWIRGWVCCRRTAACGSTGFAGVSIRRH